jgi:hypothetical protein
MWPKIGKEQRIERVINISSLNGREIYTLYNIYTAANSLKSFDIDSNERIMMSYYCLRFEH